MHGRHSLRRCQATAASVSLRKVGGEDPGWRGWVRLALGPFATWVGVNRTNLTRENLDGLKAREPVDGVGLQMHLDAAYPLAEEDIVAAMKSYGLPV